MDKNRLIPPLVEAQCDTWAQRLCEIAHEASAAFACDEVRHLRALYAMINADSLGCTMAGLTVCETAVIEGLVMAGACDSAALALLGGSSGYMISRGSAGEFMATVLLPGYAEEQTGSGDSLALALVSAIALALGVGADSGFRQRHAAEGNAAKLN